MGAIPCESCGYAVNAADARTCRDASGAVLCGSCRRRRFPRLPARHQAPRGCAFTVRPSGYGRYSCELVTPVGTFTGGGLTDELALSRARAAARSAGAVT